MKLVKSPFPKLWPRPADKPEAGTQGQNRTIELYRRLLFNSDVGERTYAAIVFSKDRPIQLEALLASLRWAICGSFPVLVLCKCTNEGFKKAYGELESQFLDHAISFHYQSEDTSFKEQLVDILTGLSQTRLFFLVDDIIFIRKFDLHDFDSYNSSDAIFCPRLGETIKYSFMIDEPEELPRSLGIHGRFLHWNWGGNDIDWSYPLSLDGNIFSRVEMLSLLELIFFNSPNTLESEMQRYVDIFRSRIGVCYRLPRLINIPCNRVQDDYDNKCIGVMNTEDLLLKWQSGFRINCEEFREKESNSVHVEWKINFVKRDS